MGCIRVITDSGVHGALVVLEPSFNGETMASALGIPQSKNIIRRHLTTELEALVLPARYVIYCQVDADQPQPPDFLQLQPLPCSPK